MNTYSYTIYTSHTHTPQNSENIAHTNFVRCGGLVVCVPATRSSRPGLVSRPGASPQRGLRDGRSFYEYCTIKLIKNSPRLAVRIIYFTVQPQEILTYPEISLSFLVIKVRVNTQ